MPRVSVMRILISLLWLPILPFCSVFASPDSGRLFEDLLVHYNKLVRPVKSDHQAVHIQFKLKLLQILDVHEKNQMVTLNGWLIHLWHDYRLAWNACEYDMVKIIHIPAELIWLPDIILYNNAAGSPQVTTKTKAHVYHTGRVAWEPPVIYNCMCQIDIEWFPYDQQFCEMKFGSWTYYGSQLDMMHLYGDTVIEKEIEPNKKVWIVEWGIDISDYQESVEWDLMSIEGWRHAQWYPCCDYPYIDITYKINIRRKTLFFTINLMTPCIGITFLTCLVFYLPSDSNNKITLSVSVLVSLTVFFLLLVDMIPPTSIKTPLIARYLLFTMIMVTCSVFCTVLVLNIHYRSDPVPLPYWTRKIFIDWVPRFLLITRPARYDVLKEKYAVLNNEAVMNVFFSESAMLMRQAPKPQDHPHHHARHALEIYKQKACRNVCYIAQQLKTEHQEAVLKDDWRFASIVVDRIFLLIFSVSIAISTIYVIWAAPTMRDDRIPITEQWPPFRNFSNETIPELVCK